MTEAEFKNEIRHYLKVMITPGNQYETIVDMLCRDARTFKVHPRLGPDVRLWIDARVRQLRRKSPQFFEYVRPRHQEGMFP